MSIRCLLLVWMILFVLGVSSQQNDSNMPKMNEIEQFCKSILEEKNEESNLNKNTPDHKKQTQKMQELSIKFEKMIPVEEQNVRQVYIRKKTNKKWAKEERIHADYLIELGLFSDAILFLKEINTRQTPWASAGSSQFLLSLIYQKRGNQTLAKACYENGQSLLKEAKERKNKKIQWAIDQSINLQRECLSKSTQFSQQHAEYVALYQSALNNPDDLSVWKKLVELSDRLEFRIEMICFLQYIWESWGKVAEAGDLSWILFNLTKIFIQTGQGGRAIEIIRKMEKDQLVNERQAPELLYFKARAYLDMQNYNEAEKCLVLMEKQFPQFYKERPALIKKIQEGIVQND